MKKLVIAAGCIALSLGFVGCGGAHGEDPGRSYMPDMYYSRAYEAYNYNNVAGERDSLASRGIFYNGLPVPGTVARGEALSYHLTNDSVGLNAAQGLKNPLDTVATKDKAGMKEAERLYLVNCGICHGDKLDGNGPLYNGGNGPYPAAPRALNAEYAKALSDGHYFHVITFGKGAMGSYASQLRPEQRWWVISYIRQRQGGAASPAKGDSSNTKVSAGLPQTQTPPAAQPSK